MAQIISMRKMSDTMSEGVVASWLVKVGDKIMGDDSTLRNVIQLCRGREEMYKIVQKCDLGEPYVVNKRHKLIIKNISQKQNI